MNTTSDKPMGRLQIQFLFVILLLNSIGCTERTITAARPFCQQDESRDQTKIEQWPKPDAVPSIIQVLADPHRFDGQQIRLKGFLVFDGEQPLLFFHKDDAQYLIESNGFMLKLGKDLSLTETKLKTQFHNRYVYVRGKFESKFKAPWHGSLTDIDRIFVLDETEYR